MTNKKFWAKLNELTKKKDTALDIAQLINMAYEEDLDIICGCKSVDDDAVTQYIVTLSYGDDDDDRERYALCYTSVDHARKDPMFEGKGEIVSVRDMVDHILNTPDLNGIVLNFYHKKQARFIPSFLLITRQAAFEYMVRNDPELIAKKLSSKYSSDY